MRFEAGLTELPGMLDFVRQAAQAAGLSADEARRLELAAEEVLVNIIQYAYPHRPGEVDIDYQIVATGEIDLTFRDRGIPFNPLDIAQPAHLSKSLDERDIGGLGVYMVRQLMDQVTYERRDQENVLRLIRKANHQ